MEKGDSEEVKLRGDSEEVKLNKIYSILSSKKSGLTQEDLSKELLASSHEGDTMMPPLNLSELITLLNQLGEQQKVEFMQLHGQIVFRARSLKEAAVLVSLSDDERIVYQFVKDTTNKGTWIKHIKEKSGLHTKVVTDNIQKLEKKGIIKAVKNVKAPTRKVYMLSEYEPSAELTGGSWYTDDAMDIEFIDQLAVQISRYIYAKSRPKDTTRIYSISHAFPTTIQDIHDWIQESQITTQTLSLSDIESLVSRLVYDGSIHLHPDGERYIGSPRGGRASHIGSDGLSGVAQGFTDAPCGNCPVSGSCRTGGVVSPTTCTYFNEWFES